MEHGAEESVAEFIDTVDAPYQYQKDRQTQEGQVYFIPDIQGSPPRSPGKSYEVFGGDDKEGENREDLERKTPKDDISAQLAGSTCY